MSDVPASVLNPRFAAAMNDPGQRAKIAQKGQNWIRDKLREERFCSKVLPLESVTYEEVQVSVNHEAPTIIVPLEPEARAMTMSFRGEPSVRLIEAARVEMAFITVASEVYQKDEGELVIYQKMDMPITKLIEDNTVFTIQAIQDREFLLHAESAVQALQAEANGVAAAPVLNGTALAGLTPPVEYSVKKSELARIDVSDTGTPWPFQISDWVSLVQIMDSRQLRCEMVLFPESDWDGVMQWTTQDMGSPLKSETVKSGYVHNELNGRKYARSNKSDILRPGNVYGFTNHEFLGKFRRLTETKFYVDKQFRTIKWQAWEDVAMLLANVASLGKIELYSGDATAHDTDSIRVNVIPLEEEAISPTNNRVESGIWYPRVVNF